MVTYEKLISQHLLAGAAINMAVDGSSTPVIYGYTVPAFNHLKLTRGMLVIEDGGSAFQPANFGALGSPLSNGVEISYTTKGKGKVTVDTWITNRQIRDTMFDMDPTFITAGAYTGRWTFSKDLGNGGLLLSAGDKFEIKIQDNLTGLTYMSFKIKGNLTVTE